MSISAFYIRRSLVVGWDVVSWLLALVTFVLVRFDLTLSPRVWFGAVVYVVTAIVLQVAAGFVFHLYRGRSRLGSFDEVSLTGSIVGGIALVLGLWYFVTQPVASRSLVLAVPALAFLIMGAGRWTFRTAAGNARRNREPSAARALIYGAGDAGHQVVRLVDFADVRIQ